MRLKHQLKTDRHGVNVWPYASAMMDESSQVKSRKSSREQELVRQRVCWRDHQLQYKAPASHVHCSHNHDRCLSDLEQHSQHSLQARCIPTAVSLHRNENSWHDHVTSDKYWEGQSRSRCQTCRVTILSWTFSLTYLVNMINRYC